MTSSFRRTAVPTLAKSFFSTFAFDLVIFGTIFLNPVSAQTPKKGDAGKDPKAAAFNKKGMGYYRQKDYAKAITELTKAIEQDPSNSYYIKNRGMVYRENKDYDKALADFTKAVEIKPDYAAAFLERGKTQHLKEDYDRAIADFTQAIKILPTYAQAFEARSLAFQAKGDTTRAQEDLRESRRLLSMPPTEGDISGLQKDQRERIQALLRQIAKSTEKIDHEAERATVTADLAALLVRTGDAKAALKLADGFRDAYKSEVYTSIAIAHAQNGQHKAAQSTADLISKSFPGMRIEALARIATTLVDVSKKDEARAIVKLTLAAHDKKEQDDPTAPFALAELAKAQAATNDIAGALKTARAIKTGRMSNPSSYARANRAFSEIAVIQAKNGDIKGARNTASMITLKPSVDLDYACVKIVSAEAARGDTKAAFRLVSLIALERMQAQALVEVMKHSPKEGGERLRKFRDEVQFLAVLSKNPAREAMVLRVIAEGFANAGNTLEADITANAIKELQFGPLGDGGIYAMALAEIALAEARSKSPASKKTFENALEVASKQKAAQSATYRVIGLAQARASEHEAAIEWASKLDRPLDQAHVLIAIAKGMLESNQRR